MTKREKHSVGKSFSKFLTTILWHLNQATPTYSRRNPSNGQRRNSTNSIPQEKSTILQNEQLINGRRYRRQSLRQRAPTLMSIEEENETDFISTR